MKVPIFSLTLLLLISCNQLNPGDDKKIEKTQFKINISDNLDIYGKWSMCSTFGNGVMTQFNVCPLVYFNSNGSGTVSKNSSTTEKFNWTLKKGILTIKNTIKFPNTTFSDSIYFASINKQNKNVDIVIHQLKNDYSYFLSRQNE